MILINYGTEVRRIIRHEPEQREWVNPRRRDLLENIRKLCEEDTEIRHDKPDPRHTLGAISRLQQCKKRTQAGVNQPDVVLKTPGPDNAINRVYPKLPTDVNIFRPATITLRSMIDFSEYYIKHLANVHAMAA